MRKLRAMWGEGSTRCCLLVGLIGLAACADKSAPSARSEAKASPSAAAKEAEEVALGTSDPAAPAGAQGKGGMGRQDFGLLDGKDKAAGPGNAPRAAAPQHDGVAAERGAPPPPESPSPSRPPAAKNEMQPRAMLADNPYGGTTAPEAPIDPNARFATTYRPGGGHLAAFDSAVARGIIPAGEQATVADIGARYAPSLDKPTTSALALRADLERGKVAPGGGPLHVRIDLQSTEKAPSERPHLSVVVVLDVSGSMRGELISSARKAATDLVDKLAPGDDFSLITFSTEAQVTVPLESVGAHRADIKKTIEGVVEGGGTNISEGLRLGYAQAHAKQIPDDAVRVVMLLSDGRANDGVTDSHQLSGMALSAFQDGVQTSTFGLGTDYDGPLMSSIADDGAGGYYYLPSPQSISAALGTEVDKRLDPVATAVEVRVRLKPGVDLLHAYGSRRLGNDEAARVRAIEVAQDQQAEKKDHIKANRKDDKEGGMRFFIPVYARNEGHAILLKLRLPEGVGDKEIALVELKYKDRVTKKNVSEEIPIKVGYADSDAASAKTIDASVSRSVQGFEAGETLIAAANAIQSGDKVRAVSLLSERIGILTVAASTLDEPLFNNDAARLSRLAVQAGAKRGPMADPLVLAMAMETAGSVHMR